MPTDFGNFEIKMNVGSGRPVAPQKTIVERAKSSSVVLDLKRDAEVDRRIATWGLGRVLDSPKEHLTAELSDFEVDAGNGYELKFLAIEAEKYTAKVCGEDTSLIVYRTFNREGKAGYQQVLSAYAAWQADPENAGLETAFEGAKNAFENLVRMGKATNWQSLDGPRVFIAQPSHPLGVEQIQFFGGIDLVDLSAAAEEQKVKLYLTIGQVKAVAQDHRLISDSHLDLAPA